MGDRDEALEFFRRERAACEDKAKSVDQEVPEFAKDMREAVRHMDTAIQALEQRTPQEAVSIAAAPEANDG